MSEPYWVALGAQAVDYEGDWAAGTQYAPGDVVLLNGVQYLAVNPSVGQAPPSFPIPTASVVPMVTALPTPTFDGQEVILVDSLTAPTYQWRLRYSASITDANKWVFVGGAPVLTEVATSETTASTTYVALTTPGPSFTIVRAGIYLVEIGAYMETRLNNTGAWMSYDIGATVAVDADAVRVGDVSVGTWHTSASVGFGRVKTLPAATALVAKYRQTGGATPAFGKRWMSVQPVRIA